MGKRYVPAHSVVTAVVLVTVVMALVLRGAFFRILPVYGAFLAVVWIAFLLSGNRLRKSPVRPKDGKTGPVLAADGRFVLAASGDDDIVVTVGRDSFATDIPGRETVFISGVSSADFSVSGNARVLVEGVSDDLHMLSVTISGNAELRFLAPAEVDIARLSASGASVCDLGGVTLATRCGFSAEGVATIVIGDAAGCLVTGTLAGMSTARIDGDCSGVRVDVMASFRLFLNGEEGESSKTIPLDLFEKTSRKMSRSVADGMFRHDPGLGRVPQASSFGSAGDLCGIGNKGGGSGGRFATVACESPSQFVRERPSDVLSGSLQVGGLLDWLSGECDKVTTRSVGACLIAVCEKATIEKGWPERLRNEAVRRFPEATAAVLVEGVVRMRLVGEGCS